MPQARRAPSPRRSPCWCSRPARCGGRRPPGRHAPAGPLPRCSLDGLSADGGSPATGCRGGASRDRLSGGGPATIVWRLVSQRNQRIDRPPFDLVTPPQSSRDGWYDAVWKQCATRPPRPSLIHGKCPRLPPGLEWATRDTGFADPRRAGVRGVNHTFLPCQGSWQGSRCPDRNLNRYAGVPPVHQAASVAQVRQRKETSPQPAPTTPPPPWSAAPTAGICSSHPPGPLARTLQDGHHAGGDTGR
jgi:hypothetical protein